MLDIEAAILEGRKHMFSSILGDIELRATRVRFERHGIAPSRSCG